MRTRHRQWAAASLLVLGAGMASVVAVQHVERQRAVARACDAAKAGDWERALRDSEGIAGSDEDGLIAAECRCWALLARGRGDECRDMLEDLLARTRDWVPHRVLTRALIAEHRAAGELEEAAALVSRAGRRYPNRTELLELDLEIRSLLEGEEEALAALEARLRHVEDPLPLRIVLARAYERRSQFEAVLRVLGERLPPVDDLRLAAWVEHRTRALGALQRIEDIQEVYAAWERAGGDPAELRARYAVRVSISQLRDPAHDTLTLLRAALADADRIDDPQVVEAVYDRLIRHLLFLNGREEEALALYEEARQRFELPSISREAILRSAAGAGPGGHPDGDSPRAPGTLSFHGADDAGTGEPGTLLVSPPADRPPDTPFQEHELAAGETVEVERLAAAFPQRWVYRDAAGRARASGVVWPIDGMRLPVTIEPREAPRRSSFALSERAPADGRRRAFVVIPDCMDWRIVQYLRARGELPVLEHLLLTGYRAVLASRPPLTAAAMQKLVWPTRGRQVTFVGLVHRLGLELGGLASVGRNPVGVLANLLPEGENLFETVGAGDRVAVNMLFSHGLIDAGRHAEIVGPGGRRRPARTIRAFRPLTPAERERIPTSLLASSSFDQHMQGLAAAMDAAQRFAEEGEVDLLMLRLEPLDLLTHERYGELARTGQEDGRSALPAAYRYIDRRLGELLGALDRDDVLIVMSDHGIQSAMEHSEDAIFVAAGEGVPHGRAEGMPDLRGVPAVLASLLDLRTGWPRSGVAPWTERSLTASTAR